MAGNETSGNPITIDTEDAIWTSNKYVQLIQWIDNAAAIANNNTLVLAINGVTVTAKIAMTADTINNAVVWSMQFAPPMRIETFTVTTIDNGLLVIWIA